MKNLKIIVAHPEVKIQICENALCLGEESIASDRLLSRHILEALDKLRKEQNLTIADIQDISVQEERPSFSATRTARMTAMMLGEAWGIADQ